MSPADWLARIIVGAVLLGGLGWAAYMIWTATVDMWRSHRKFLFQFWATIAGGCALLWALIHLGIIV